MTTLTVLAQSDVQPDVVDKTGKRLVRGILLGDAETNTLYEFRAELYRPGEPAPYRALHYLLNHDDPTFVPVGRRDLFAHTLRIWRGDHP